MNPLQHQQVSSPVASARGVLISIVIVNWNGLHLLQPCIAALHRQTERRFEVIVVDNGSTDGSLAWLAEQSEIRLIRNSTNQGFAPATNQGIRASHAPFVALLNNDTEPDPQWLEFLLQAMDTPQVGSANGVLLFAAHPDRVQSAGIAMDRAAIAWDRFGGLPRTHALVQQPAEIFGASGGAALYRRAMLDDIGLLNERYFAYLEDVELAWRAQKAGWVCQYVPQATVLHHTSATAGEGSPFKQRLLGRNKVWLVAQHAPLKDIPLILLYDMLAVGWALVRRRNPHHLIGRLHALRELPAILRERHGGTAAHIEAAPLPWRIPSRYSHLG
jgi:GT2 family glycosyltransferase